MKMYFENTNNAVVALFLFSGYLLLVRSLRYRRRDEIESKFTAGKRPLSSMTTKEAADIIHKLQELEFPYNLHNALSIGLTKTAGIPTISKLLVATGQLNHANILKRAADTDVLLAEIQSTDPESIRHFQAVARINYFHERYRKAGKLLDDDMLHTLASGVVEPFRFIDNFEWRKLSDTEKCAYGVFHKALGEAMGVSFEKLPSSETGWKDGLEFALELEAWVYRYEKEVAQPTKSNTTLASRFVESAAAGVPSFLKPVVQTVLVATYDGHMRKSMGLDDPSLLATSLLRAFRTTRKLLLRYLALPRPDFMAVHLINAHPNALTGLYNFNAYRGQPWYVKPTLKNRWGPKTWLARLLGSDIIVPGDDGDKYHPQGYDLKTIGPAAMQGKGIAEMEENVRVLSSQPRGGCPFGRI